MKNIALLTFAIAASLVISCNGRFSEKSLNNERTAIYMNDSSSSLMDIIFKKVNAESDINVEVALQSIVKQFERSSVDTTSNEKPIDIYVIYDTALWDEYDESETFQITLAHQAVERKVLYEYRCTFIFDPSEVGQMTELDVRYNQDSDNMEEFMLAVRESSGYKKAQHLTPTKIEIIREEI